VIGIPKADPTGPWNIAKANLINGNVEGALPQFSTTTIHDYRSLFNWLSPATLSQNMNAVGPLTPIYIDDDEARYYFTTTINNQPFGFIVTFVNELGVWKIRSF
jgi:hypothetical protein